MQMLMYHPGARLLRLVLITCVAMILLALVGTGQAHAATQTVDGSGNESDWTANVSSPDGLVAFHEGPADPPAGAGSVRLFTGTHGDNAAEIRSSNSDGVRLADIEALSYATYATSWNGSQVPYIILRVDTDQNGAPDDLLFFEPEYQNGYTSNVPTQEDVALNTWQSWNARSGGWWSLNNIAGAGPGGAVKTLDEYVSAVPNATIENTASGAAGVRIVSGFANQSDVFDANVDDVSIDLAGSDPATYDFEDNQGTLSVCPSGCPYAKIQDTVAAAQDGDTVEVGAGTYPEQVNVNKPLTLNGAQAGTDAKERTGAESTVGNPSGAFNLTSANVRVDGFTIQGVDGSLSGSLGAGVVLSANGSGYQIVNNIIQNNTFGLYLNSSGATQTLIQNNAFQNNNTPGAASGNAIYTDQGSRNVRVETNRFSGHSSAAIVFAGAPGTQSDLSITQNKMVSDNSMVLFNATNVSVNGNESAAPQGSGVYLGGGNAGISIQNNTIMDGASSAIRVIDNGSGPNTNVSIVGNNLTGNDYGIRASSGSHLGLEAHQNRIVGNVTAGVRNDDPTSINAENNWWGCNKGPNEEGCDTTSGQMDFDPWLELNANADPDTIGTRETSEITATLTGNSAGETVDPFLLPDVGSVTFSTGDVGSVDLTEVPIRNGSATTTFTASNRTGMADVDATHDNATTSAEPEITGPGDCTIVGTDGDDDYSGTKGDDVICGLGGNDTLRARDGNDRLRGGDGHDNLFGGSGSDTLRGKVGSDTAVGGPGADTISGEEGSDHLRGQIGTDRIVGGIGQDELFGGDGSDRILGQQGADTLNGGNTGQDELYGGEGGDSLSVRDGRSNDLANGGANNDSCRADSGDRKVNCED